MRCCFFFYFLLFVITAVGQTHRIDSLKKMLPGLSNRELVNCLNTLGQEFNFYFIHSDSALKYATLAYDKAAAIQYNSGIAVSLITRAEVQGRLLGHPKLMESYAEQAIELLKNEGDSKNLSTAYCKLAFAYAAQGMYDSAHIATLKAKQIAIVINDKSGLAWAIGTMGIIDCQIGEYWKGFQNLIESQQMGKELNDSLLTSASLAFIARSFNRAGDPQKAISYYQQSLQFATPFLLLWPHLEDMAYAYLQLKQYDSVLYYQQKHRHNLDSLTTDTLVRKKFSAFLWGYSIDVQLARRQYNQVFADVLPRLQLLRKSRDVFPLMQSLFSLGKVYDATGNYQTSLKYSRELLQIAQQANNKQYLKEANQLMASLFDHIKQPDSAYIYFKKFTAIKDTMATAQYAQRTILYLSASEAENRINLLKKDKEINVQQMALNKKELQKQSQLKNILWVSLFVLLLISVLVVRNIILKSKNDKLQNEQAQLELKRKALELEMKAMQAQMNPHFIFNCLNSIDNLIQSNEKEKATLYLSKFAKLVRSILETSKKNTVPCWKDMETLKLYLELEELRRDKKFSYQINIPDEIINGDYNVPPLIIQPFVENAIQHGLLNKTGDDRKLVIDVAVEQNYIRYTIVDNGVGRAKAGVYKKLNNPSHQSMGMQITADRINLFNQNTNGSVKTTDLYDAQQLPAGTKVEVELINQ